MSIRKGAKRVHVSTKKAIPLEFLVEFGVSLIDVVDVVVVVVRSPPRVLGPFLDLLVEVDDHAGDGFGRRLVSAVDDGRVGVEDFLAEILDLRDVGVHVWLHLLRQAAVLTSRRGRVSGKALVRIRLLLLLSNG